MIGGDVLIRVPRVALRASALTFYSLLSIVPIAAMVFGIAKGFGFEENLEKVLLKSLEGQEEIVRKVVVFAHALLEDVKGGFMAGVGLAILFYTIIKILSHIENAFNDIWGIRKSRSFGRKISDYLALMLVCPMILLLSSTLTVFISSGVKVVVTRIALLGTVGPVIFFLLNLLPYVSIWILLTMVYLVMPNTRIPIRSAIIGGIAAGTIMAAQPAAPGAGDAGRARAGCGWHAGGPAGPGAGALVMLLALLAGLALLRRRALARALT